MMDATELRRRAGTFKVDFRPGTLFSSRGELKDYIRLCCVHYEAEEIEEGIMRLKKCSGKYMNHDNPKLPAPPTGTAAGAGRVALAQSGATNGILSRVEG